MRRHLIPPAPMLRGMRPELLAHASLQHGLVTRRQAVAAGYTERELRTLTKAGGTWVVVRRGVYMERTTWDLLPAYGGEMAARDHAAHLVMVRTHLMSHDSAARAHGLPLLRPQHDLVHVTRPGVGGGRTEHGVKHHIGKALPEVVSVADLPVTSLARTSLDLAREHGFAQGLGACDAAMRRGVTIENFDLELAQLWSWPYVGSARAAVEYADPGAENIGESLARLLVIELGLVGDLETQFPVALPGGIAWCDIRVGCHLFEFDGRQKYLRPVDGGVSEKEASQVVWDERQRQTEVCGHGLGMSRIVWADLWGQSRERAKARLRAEAMVTLQRFGHQLPADVAAFAERMRGRRRSA